MKKCVVFIVTGILFLAAQIGAQSTAPFQKDLKEEEHFPEVPRVSAYEAYLKYKNGKAIIVHAGGEAYRKRHIMGAFDVDGDGVVHKGKTVPNFPKSGVEIFIYCY